MTISYHGALPRKKVFTWDKIGYFRPDQNLLMHSLCYRVDVLREANLPLPAHTFYVDNIYAYVPLPHCKTMYYADIDLYRYFIGREGQSVNEATMIRRLDQQFRITRIMMNAYHLYTDVKEPRLASYMMGYFTMMMSVCSIFSKLSEEDRWKEESKRLWAELKEYDERMYRHARCGILGIGTNLPRRRGRRPRSGSIAQQARSSNSINIAPVGAGHIVVLNILEGPAAPGLLRNCARNDTPGHLLYIHLRRFGR